MAKLLADDFNTGVIGERLNVYSPDWPKYGFAAGNMVISATNGIENAEGAGGSVASNYRADLVLPSADYSVSADVISGTYIIGVIARVSLSASTFYQARLNGYGTIELARSVNGAFTTMVSAPTNRTTQAKYRLRLECKDSQISVYLDDAATPLLTATSTHITTAGKAGVRSGPGSGYIDNFSIDTIDSVEGISASLNATLAEAISSSSANLQVEGVLVSELAAVILEMSGTLESKVSLVKTLAPATLTAAAYIEIEPPAPDGIEVALLSTLSAATLAAAASLAVNGVLSSTLAGPTLVAAARTSTAFDILRLHPARVVRFGGSGSRVVVFEGSGSRVVVFEGSGKRIRINEMDVKVPIKDGEKWKVERDRDEISYYAADITNELRDRNTTAVESAVIPLTYGVELLEGPEVQVATVEGVERTFVVVKLGDVDGELPDDWRWVARVPCANGERFDKTTWFSEVDP